MGEVCCTVIVSRSDYAQLLTWPGYSTQSSTAMQNALFR